MWALGQTGPPLNDSGSVPAIAVDVTAALLTDSEVDISGMVVSGRVGSLNAESFCERVLFCVKLVVSDIHVSLKPEEIRMLVILRMNREFMDYMYMRATDPNTPLSDFKVPDAYVQSHGGIDALEKDVLRKMRKMRSRFFR